MFTLMVVVFVLGYVAIALEHTIKVDKAASALLIGAITWTILALDGTNILSLGFNFEWSNLISGFELNTHQISELSHSFIKSELAHHLSEISEILFFLLGAMTIVEVVDHHQGFKIITDKIKTQNKVKLLWILGLLTFFMSAALDNLTTTIVMVTLLRKLIDDKETRWLFASMVIISANAGGAWSPIGDVTTIMLWIGGQVTAANIILMVFIPSLVAMLVPLVIMSFILKGEVTRPNLHGGKKIDFTTDKEKKIFLIVGVSALLFVPVFKTITHLPPYMGMLLGLGVIWVLSEINNKGKEEEDKAHLSVVNILKRVDIPTVMFFLGILTAVASLQTAGHLSQVSVWLDEVTNKNIYIIDSTIGVLSSIVDNVPLVAGTMGMYEIAHVGTYAQDGVFWELLAYCAGTGGSILIIGSAAGVAAMGMEKIDFVWYLKRISLLALIGYLAGVGTYFVQEKIVGASEEIEVIHHQVETPTSIIKVGDHDHIKLETEFTLEIRKQNEDGSLRHED